MKIPLAETEAYYSEQEEFMRYIQDEVNPAREKAHLLPIRKYEAKECYRILHEMWSKLEDKR